MQKAVDIYPSRTHCSPLRGGGLSWSTAVIPGAGDKIHRFEGGRESGTPPFKYLHRPPGHPPCPRVAALPNPQAAFQSPAPFSARLSSRLVLSSCFVLRAPCSVQWQ